MDQRQFEATLADAEIRLRRLRMLYDQWFAGIERLEPRIQRTDVDRVIGELRKAQPRNTALRFRFNQLVQRYTTYNTYWQRITRQIEEGTYKRDVLRAKRRFSEPRAAEDKPAPHDGYDLDLDIDIEAALEAVRKSEPPIVVGVPPPQAEEKRSSSRPPPSSERPLRALREITPFALPTDAPPPSKHNPAMVPPMPSSRATQKGPFPTLSTAQPARSLPAVPPPPSGGAGVTAQALSRKPPPLPGGGPQAAPAAAAAAQRAASAAAAAQRAASAAAPASPGSPALSEDQIQNIYKRYVDARRNNSERTDNVKIETVAKTVRDMMPKLAQKHAGKRIDFEVVVKDGKVALKPVAK